MITIISYCLLFASVTFAFWRGGGPERVFASILSVMFLLDRVGHILLFDRTKVEIDYLHLVIDFAALGAMVVTSLLARRYWPLWATSCQLVSTYSHLGWAFDTRIPQAVYLTMDIAPWYLISLALIWGTHAHKQRIARHGADLSWRSF